MIVYNKVSRAFKGINSLGPVLAWLVWHILWSLAWSDHTGSTSPSLHKLGTLSVLTLIDCRPRSVFLMSYDKVSKARKWCREKCPARLARGTVHRAKLVWEAFSDPSWTVVLSAIPSGPGHLLLCLDMLARILRGCLSSNDPQDLPRGPRVEQHNCFPLPLFLHLMVSAGAWELGLFSPLSSPDLYAGPHLFTLVWHIKKW